MTGDDLERRKASPTASEWLVDTMEAIDRQYHEHVRAEKAGMPPSRWDPIEARSRVVESRRQSPDVSEWPDTERLVALLEELMAKVEAIDRKVSGLERPEPTGLLSVDEVADLLGVGAAYVYTHQHRLGVRRLGNGPKPRLRFERAAVEQHARGQTQEPAPRVRAKRYGAAA